MTLIDLDRPADRPTDGERPPLSRYRVAVVALLAGAVIGGLVTHRWTVQQAQAIDGRKVSLLLFADQQAEGSAVDSVVNSAGNSQVTFDAAIAVVNAGPLSIELRSLATQNAELTVAGPAGPQWIPPGTSSLVDVAVTANCVTRKTIGGTRGTIGGGIVQVTASVWTTGGSMATVTSLSLDTSPWTSTLLSAVTKCVLART